MSYSFDEHYSQYDETTTQSQEVVKCDACDEPIASGQKYVLIEIWHQDDEVEDEDDNHKRESDNGLYLTNEPSESLNRCARCQTIHLHLRELTPSGDQMWPHEQLNCGEEYAEHWGKEPPAEIAALAFALPEEVQAKL